jgi:hypothetical protein
MRCVVFFVALSAGLFAAPVDARAERGDMQLRVVSGHEIGIVRHPALNPEPGSWPKVYLPRFGVNYLYGLSRNFSVGVGIEASLQRTLSTNNIGYQAFAPANLNAAYNDLFIPLILETRLNDGSEWSWLAEFSTGLAVVHWHDNTLRAPASAAELFFLKGDLWRFAWFGRVSLAREWRPDNHFALRIGALAGVKSQGDLHFGLFVSGDWLCLGDPDDI